MTGNAQALLVTVDTNLLDESIVEQLRLAAGPLVEFATVTVNDRERDHTATDEAVRREPLVWDELSWDEAEWSGPIPELLVLDETPLGCGILAGENRIDVLESALAIISNGSFPKAGARESVSEPTQRQLRDAMSYEAHVRSRRHVFVTNDTKGFVNHGRRGALERLGQTYIRTAVEFIDLGQASVVGSSGRPGDGSARSKPDAVLDRGAGASRHRRGEPRPPEPAQ